MVAKREHRDVAAMLEKLAGRRWRSADARPLVAAWRESGMSARAFGKEHGLDPQRLHWWGHRLGQSSGRRKKRNKVRGARFVRAKIVGMPVAMAGASVVVRVGTGVALEVDAAVVSPEWLASLLECLSRR